MAKKETEEKLEVSDPKLATVPEKPSIGSAFHDELMAKVADEYEQASNYVSPRRQQFRDRLKLYNNQRKQRDKIGITSIYSTMATLLAIYYTDELSVGVGGRGFSGSDRAENLENVFKADQDEMDMPTLNYLTQWDRFFFGVGIRHVSGWDKDKACPIVISKDPLSWLPDPHGGLRAEDFRFMGFEEEVAYEDLDEECGFYNVHLVNEHQREDDETENTKQARALAQGLDKVDEGRKKHIRVVPVLNWFTIINGKRYLTTWANEQTLLIRFEEIKPVFRNEKEEPLNCPWGITLHYYSPERGNPFGTSVPDLVEDKQRAKSILANLEVAKEKADLYPMYIYNRDKILNRRDLDFAFNKFIGVRGDISGVVEPLRRDSNKVGNTENIKATLDHEVALSTGADANQSGVIGADSRTLGEVQQAQANANIRFILGSRVNAWGEVAFWKLCYRTYIEFFSESEEKVIEVNNPFGIQTVVLESKQFLTSERVPKLVIRSKTETEQKRSMERVAFLSVAPLILQDPSRPQVSRRFAERHLLSLHGLSRETISVLSPPTVDEMAAQRENELLSRNIPSKITDHDDHLSHIVVHQAAADSTAKRVHVESHRKAYILSGQQARDQALQAQAIQQLAPQATTTQTMNSNMAAQQQANQPLANPSGAV